MAQIVVALCLMAWSSWIDFTPRFFGFFFAPFCWGGFFFGLVMGAEDVLALTGGMSLLWPFFLLFVMMGGFFFCSGDLGGFIWCDFFFLRLFAAAFFWDA